MNVLRPCRVRFVVALLLPVLAFLAMAAPATAQQDFYTVDLCRAYDSRGAGGPLDPGTIYDVTVGGVCNVPADATGVALNVTIISPEAGDLVIFPAGGAPPAGSPPVNGMIFRSGRTQAKNYQVGLGTGGAVSFRVNTAPGNPDIFQLIIDVAGYYKVSPPEAVDDSYAAEKDKTLNVAAASGVTSNDTLLSGAAIASYGASTGAEQTTIGAATPTSGGGSVVLNANGSFSYTPPAGEVGIDDTFKYILQNAGGTSTATVTIGVGKASQTISFTSTAPSNATVGGTTYAVTATATSGLPVALTIDAAAASVCSISGSTVSFIGVGTCVINANQAGDTNYNAAPQVQQSFAVGKGDQTVSFTSTAPSDAQVGGTAYNVTATASSGLTVALTIDASAST
ncbi:MAG TPA: Ig-like domain-containing protein, partial [Thermoanaerobaculia bacterium]|nr:Ig-like domain-containing protein [Thermoanaerobaculia bacterium]